MKQKTDVTIHKLSESAEPDFRAEKKENHIDGGFNLFNSLPTEYNLKGVLTEDLELGGAIIAQRYERNGEKIGGWFMSSPIVNIQENGGEYIVTTRNSIYKLTTN